MAYTPIKDYAIIGNLRSAVLVSKTGSIDWAPAPFIDSASIFSAILDQEKGGFWKIAPNDTLTSKQRYYPNTNVLLTQFVTKKGEGEITDFIPIEKEKTFVPEEEDTTFRIHRKVSCTKGTCTFTVVFCPRLDYARQETFLSAVVGGVDVRNDQGVVTGVLASDADFIIKNDVATASITLQEGESDFLVFRYNVTEVGERENGHEHHTEELEEIKMFWHDWTHKCDLKTCPTGGKWHGMAVRSALMLKILFFEPVGTIAAAPTTSLPETIGGVRNWDYRFTWIRDASFTLQAFFRMGHVAEAEEYFAWLMGRCECVLNGTCDLQIMYGLKGESELDEEILPHLDGYRDSKPVRIGNNAYKQKQWDIYGSILDTAWQLHVLERTHVVNKHSWELLRFIANYVVKVWNEPDEGLWEVRGGKMHFVHSKLMCWVALDRALKLATAYQFDGEIALWEKHRDDIRKAIMERGWSKKKQAFVQSFDGENLDAALLLMPVFGFIDGRDPKMLSTIKAIRKELSAGNGLLYRYLSDDGLPGSEGAFLFASFWLVDALILAGRAPEAKSLFEEVCSRANHVGLFSEEIDPKTGNFLGNFPQAFTHIGLINSAYNLAAAGMDK